MIEANMLEAKTKLSRLVDAAERGEQVFLKRNGVLVAQIIPVPRGKFPFGFLKDQAGKIPDYLLFDSSEDELDEFTRPPAHVTGKPPRGLPCDARSKYHQDLRK